MVEVYFLLLSNLKYYDILISYSILRNQVWRFDPQNGYIERNKLIFKMSSVGMKRGFLIAVGVVLLQTAYSKFFGPKDHGHGHQHH